MVLLIFRSSIHSDHFYSASSSPLLLRSAPDTARILCLSFTPKHHRQLRVKDLPKVPTWQLERDAFMHRALHIDLYWTPLPFSLTIVLFCLRFHSNSIHE